MFDTGYDNMNIGVVIFRGLTGGGGGGGVGVASIQVKCIAGLEIAPNPAAADRVFAEPAAAYDPAAMAAYYKIVMELKDSYPGDYNSLEDIWGEIKNAASSVWDKVAEPIIAQVVPHIVNAGEGLLKQGLARFGGGMSRGGGVRGVRLSRVRPARPQARSSKALVTYRAPTASRSRSKPRAILKTPKHKKPKR
jgi:hypothetical protein